MEIIESTLHLEKEKLRLTLASIGDAVVITDVEGLVTSLNPAAEALTGWSNEDAVRSPLDRVFRIIDEKSRATVVNPAVQALRAAHAVDLASQTLLIAKDGTERPIDGNAAPMREGRGVASGVVLVFRDISTRRIAERGLKEAHGYCSDVIATLRDPFLVLDGDLVVKSANRAFYTSFQTTPEKTEGRRIYELGDGQWDTPKLRGLLEKVLTENSSFENFATDHDFPSVGLRSKMLNARRLRTEGNDSELILLAIEDVTSRNQALKLLEDSEVRYRRLFEAAEDAILILDEPKGTINDANPFLEKLLGYTREDLLGKELWEIGLFADIDANKRMFSELQKTGYVRYDHLPLRTKDGRTAHVEFVSNIYSVDHTQVIQCNIRDIGERVRLEKHVASQAEDLADLHRRKDEFLAMLAHELRNPLSPIVNSVALLRAQGGESTVQRHAREVIERQVGQLTRLVDDLVEVSRVTLGQIKLNREVIDLRSVVATAVSSARPLIARCRHELSVSLPEEPLWILSDASRMEQVAVNLLNNAAKYMDEGGKIWLTAEAEGSEAVLRVKDAGIGIPSDILSRVFELFMQGPRTLDRSQGGLGIGLSLASKLVELHGGTIAAESRGPGLGSEFTVRLPSCPPRTARPISPPEETGEETGVGHRILVVDDNADATDSMVTLLKLSGYGVQAAYTGVEAIAVASSFRPHAVVLDIGLPEMNGYEVAQRLRRDAAHEGIALIALTGYGQESDHRRTLEAGFDRHLVKPVQPDLLQSVLTKLLERIPREE